MRYSISSFCSSCTTLLHHDGLKCCNFLGICLINFISNLDQKTCKVTSPGSSFDKVKINSTICVADLYGKDITTERY